MQKCHIDNLVIEVTRRCNMQCLHCLRGGAQRKNLNIGILDELFSYVKGVGTIVLTGGEPSLNVDGIEAILAACRKHNVKIDHVWLATNGKYVPEKFLDVCRRWHLYTMECSYHSLADYPDAKYVKYMISENNGQNEFRGCEVAVSLDDYHEPIPKKNIIRLLSLPHLTLDKANTDRHDTEWLLGSGRAAVNCLTDKTIRQERPYMFGTSARFLDVEGNAENPIIAEMYMTCDGDILKYCDYSYAEMKKHIVTKIDPSKKGKWYDDIAAMKKDEG